MLNCQVDRNCCVVSIPLGSAWKQTSLNETFRGFLRLLEEDTGTAVPHNSSTSFTIQFITDLSLRLHCRALFVECLTFKDSFFTVPELNSSDKSFLSVCCLSGNVSRTARFILLELWAGFDYVCTLLLWSLHKSWDALVTLLLSSFTFSDCQDNCKNWCQFVLMTLLRYNQDYCKHSHNLI